VEYAGSDFLWLQVCAAGVQALEHVVDTALVLSWMILADDRRVDNRVVQPSTFFFRQRLVCLSLELRLDLPKGKCFSTQDATVERPKCAKSLLTIDDKQYTRFRFLGEEYARDWKAEQK